MQTRLASGLGAGSCCFLAYRLFSVAWIRNLKYRRPALSVADRTHGGQDGVAARLARVAAGRERPGPDPG